MAENKNTEAEEALPSDFIRDAIREDLESGRAEGVVTRWPPEPNGYIHIGHLKRIFAGSDTTGVTVSISPRTILVNSTSSR